MDSKNNPPVRLWINEYAPVSPAAYNKLNPVHVSGPVFVDSKKSAEMAVVLKRLSRLMTEVNAAIAALEEAGASLTFKLTKDGIFVTSNIGDERST